MRRISYSFVSFKVELAFYQLTVYFNKQEIIENRAFMFKTKFVLKKYNLYLFSKHIIVAFTDVKTLTEIVT